jgi:hypothetical protein
MGLSGMCILQKGLYEGTDLLEGPVCVVYASLHQHKEESKKHLLETSVNNM